MIDPITDAMIASQAIEAMRSVYDPELGIDVIALGLIYGVHVDHDHIKVDMTLTTPGCPVSEQLPAEVEAAVTEALPQATVEVEIVWDPPWNPDRMYAVSVTPPRDDTRSPGAVAIPEVSVDGSIRIDEAKYPSTLRGGSPTKEAGR